MSELRAYILCRFAEYSSLYKSWLDQCPLPPVIVDEYLPDWVLPDDAGIIITHMHYRYEDIAALRRIYDGGRVPILILADGILEYRNTWDHPEIPDGSLFQPACGHKISCVGRGQARVMESWGNIGKCEVVGLPRFDPITLATPPPLPSNDTFRILVATANTPSFTDAQRETVIASLKEVRQWQLANKELNGRPVEFVWRLTDELEQPTGLEPHEYAAGPDDELPLGEVIARSHAVITTPSTLYLESVVQQRPTAILDFHNCPPYVVPAWNIAAAAHVDPVIRELADPPGAKMMFQESGFHDQLECHTPATPRLLQLILEMVSATRTSRATHTPLALPKRILGDPQKGFAFVPSSYNLKQLYRGNETYRDQERAGLQLELNAARLRLGQLPKELDEKNRYVSRVLETLGTSRNRAAMNHARLNAAKKRIENLKRKIEKLETRPKEEPPPI